MDDESVNWGYFYFRKPLNIETLKDLRVMKPVIFHHFGLGFCRILNLFVENYDMYHILYSHKKPRSSLIFLGSAFIFGK